jgi:TRAP-type mannitol/chloroaromatic compound transport system permease small subunit
MMALGGRLLSVLQEAWLPFIGHLWFMEPISLLVIWLGCRGVVTDK